MIDQTELPASLQEQSHHMIPHSCRELSSVSPVPVAGNRERRRVGRREGGRERFGLRWNLLLLLLPTGRWIESLETEVERRLIGEGREEVEIKRRRGGLGEVVEVRPERRVRLREGR